MVVLLLIHWLLQASHAAEYTKHITPIDYEVPHSVIFKDEQCYSRAEKAIITVPRNCTDSYCSKCYYNREVRDYKNHYMSYNDNQLIVGAVDTLLAFDVTDKLFSVMSLVDVEISTIDIRADPTCKGDKNRKMQECRNYNRVIVALTNTHLLTCGTAAFSVDKSCQIRQVNQLEEYTALNGEAASPINKDAWNTALYTDNKLFSGTMVSGNPSDDMFAITSAKVMPQSMEFTGRVSTMLHSSFLNRPKFVAVFVYGDYVYYLFQELDYALLDKTQTVVSRIARVCKDDAGVKSDTGLNNTKLWRTFAKARIFCDNEVKDETFGTQRFSYNRIGDGKLDQDTLYATFSGGDTSASGSVLCRFNMRDIDDILDNSYYYKFTGSKIEKIKPNMPPTCDAMGERTVSDINTFQLTTRVVTSKDAPLFLQSGPRFTKLLLDSNIQNLTNPFFFIGTNLGSVLKATWLTDPITNAMQPILVEQLNVAVGDIGDDLSVNFLAFERTTDPKYIFVGTGVSVSKVVIPRCLRIPSLSKSCCMASRDPYCGWCDGMDKCTSRSDCSNQWLQSINYDGSSTCTGIKPTTPPPQPTVKPGSDDVVTTVAPTTPTTSPPLITTKQPVVTLPPRPNVTSESNSVENVTERVVTQESTTQNVDPQAATDEMDGWKSVAIVMAILCGIFVLITLALSANLARRWCSRQAKPVKSNNNNIAHKNYNPLSTNGPKQNNIDEFTPIPVYNRSQQV